MYGFRYGYRGRQRGVRGWGAVEPLFALGEQGLWLDPSDHSTLFQDTAGATPVTAPGQTVALARDKSGRGNYIIQPVALSRPTLGRHPVGGARNLLVGSEGQRGWSAVGTAPPTVASATHLGKPCWSVTFPAGSIEGWNVSRAVYQYQSYPFPNAYSWSYKVATSRPLVAGEKFAVLLNGSFATAGMTFTSANDLTEWQTRSVPNIVNNNAPPTTSLYPAVTYAVTLGEPLTIYITDMQMELGAASTAYQRVASAWDATEEGKRDCWYLGFDGVDDFMVSAAAVDLSASSKLSIFAGLRREKALGDTAMLAELGVNVNVTDGTFYVVSPGYVSSVPYAHVLAARGTPGAFPVLSLASSTPADYVASHSMDTASYARTRINGTLVSNSPFSQGGNFSASQKLYVGARAGTALFFKGRIYQLAIRGADTPDAQVPSVEAYLVDRMGTAP